MVWRRSGAQVCWLGLCLLVLVGCDRGDGTSETPTYPFIGLQVNVGVVGDPKVAEVLASPLVGEWEATRKAKVVLSKEPVAAIEAARFDVILFPGDHLGELVDAKALMTWPEKLVLPAVAADSVAGEREPSSAEKPNDPFQFADVVQTYRDQVSKYGADRIALPLGGTGLVLVYDKGAFDRPQNREAAEKGHVRLSPPTTWKELDELANFFEGRDWNGDGKPEHGIAVVLGADEEGLGNSLFLARAASLGQHKDQYSFCFDSDSMAPRVATPPFVEALDGLLALRKCGPPALESFDGERARRAFAEGEVALLIDLAERSESWTKKKAVGVAALPGAEHVFDPLRERWEDLATPNRPSYLPRGGGWLVGISASSKGPKRDAAIDFAKYITSPELANQVRTNSEFPMLPVRSTTLGQGPTSANAVDARQWADAVGRTLAAQRVIPGLRIPGADGYLSDLASGRAAALKGEPPKVALEKVARAWQERTQRLGTACQAWHYQRSLNSIVTTPEPPR
ncbi:MAG: extracellular solute-binding protein [Isosphaeraceae bacterium]|nr:extracellular solute-binding protein [Isosphaeraceae bacterium]